MYKNVDYLKVFSSRIFLNCFFFFAKIYVTEAYIKTFVRFFFIRLRDCSENYLFSLDCIFFIWCKREV